jgi:NAD(P)H-hydrate epimerase
VPSDLFPHYIGKLPSCILQEGQDITREVCSSQCVAVGMGMGATAQTYHTVEKLLQEYEGILILDADALNVLAEYGKGILKQAKCRVVLTPHLKEFSRLTGRSVREIKSNLIDEAKNFAREYGVILLLKSNTSVVTDGERLALVPVNQPVLARAGSGDILSGYLAGTCARGVAPFDACCVSTYVLGFTAAVMESAQGEYIPNASDLLSYLYKGQHVAISEGYVIED